MQMKRFGTIGMLVLLPCMLSGCAAALLAGGAAVGAGTFAFVNGQLQTTEEVPLDRAWAASVKAMDQMQFSIKKREKDALHARVTAMDSRKRYIVIDLNRENSYLTKITIRVGMFGDEKASELILSKIRRNLKKR